MKVDMSPAAVTSRLRTLDELWLLSVKLMNSKKVSDRDENKNRIVETKKVEGRNVHDRYSFVNDGIGPEE